jgi:hypothetical protein
MSKTNSISREEIIEILKKKSVDDDKKYSLLSILKYNIVLEPDDIKIYLNSRNVNPYLYVVKNIDAITFNKSIHMFHDLNDLILIFYEKSAVHAANNTKKIYLNANKKTIKKRYKD